MKKANKKLVDRKLGKKKIVLIVAAVLALLVAGWMVFSAVRTYPLGEDGRVVYLGKEGRGDIGPLSSSAPYDVYFYGTDMTPEELANYLGAEIERATGVSSDSPSYEFRMKSGKSVPIQFYREKSSTYISPPEWAKATSKRYFFYILDSYYDRLVSNFR
jgi:hypothetical protein